MRIIDAKFIYYRFTMVQVKPQTLYFEEDVTMNAEFPEEGKFHLSLLPGNRYKVCGDPEEVRFFPLGGFALCPECPAADIHGGGMDHPRECVLGPGSMDELGQ